MTARRLALVVAIAATAISPASAAAHERHHAHIVPARHVAGLTGGQVLAEAWLPAYTGAPSGPCTRLGPDGRILIIGPADETVTCTMQLGTPVFVLGFGSSCSDVEPAPFYAVGAAAQRACAVAGDHRFIRALRVGVDGAASVNLRRPRFELVSPQTAFTSPSGDGTFRVHAWAAALCGLRRGVHTIVADVSTRDFHLTTTTILNVL